ncbi:hypothetical protein A8950_0804 [Dongia mobilis]|uniref:Lipoprotein n=1 Tax=Dongia mobilis TaxID=578943 RepID=A0A4R6WRW8_9PROT|nr:hypothetical protein [Dongia mobilis]TDQ84256.1 hypothetical protein A8950_0804 [Dongia mobilis]
MRHNILTLAVLLPLAGAVLVACEPGMGPFQPSPFAGFPPNFADAKLNAYRAQYLSDISQLEADPTAFMGRNQPGITCAMSAEAQKAFAEASYMPPLNERSPTWEKVTSANDYQKSPPIFDQATVKLLEGDCTGGAINGRASVHARYNRLDRSGFVAAQQGEYVSFQILAVELRETCDYLQSRRAGNCARYQVLTLSGATMFEGKLLPDQGGVAHKIFVFDYGAYADDRERGVGVAFQTYGDSHPFAGQNTTLARLPDGADLIRYEEYAGGEPPSVIYSRLLPDYLLHGPLYWGGGIEMSCYDHGKEVMRVDCGSE